MSFLKSQQTSKHGNSALFHVVFSLLYVSIIIDALVLFCSASFVFSQEVKTNTVRENYDLISEHHFYNTPAESANSKYPNFSHVNSYDDFPLNNIPSENYNLLNSNRNSGVNENERLLSNEVLSTEVIPFDAIFTEKAIFSNNTTFHQEKVSVSAEEEEERGSEEEEMILAQRRLNNHPKTGSFRSSISHPNTANRRNAFAGCRTQSVCYNWFDEQQGKHVPVKIYFPQHLNHKAPVIIFSHGLGGSRDSCAYLGEYWAVNGYVSVHLQHLGSDETVWKGKVRPIKELKKVYPQCRNGHGRVLDIQFALSTLQSMSHESQTYLSRILDMDRVGIAGYDLGAYAALLMAGQASPDGHATIHDPRIKAALVMSPPFPPHPLPASMIYAEIETPCMFFTGTKDEGLIGNTTPAQRRIPFDSLTCNDQYLITFNGTDHFIYTGHLFPMLPKNDAPYQVSISRFSTNFWNAYLKEDPNALAFMMSRNITTLLNGLGRIERKFYVREELNVEQQTSEELPIPEVQKRDTEPKPEETKIVQQRLQRADISGNRLVPRRLKGPQEQKNSLLGNRQD